MNRLTNLTKYYFQSGGSIIDFLKSEGLSSDKATRKELAKKLGFKGDLTAADNTALLNYLQASKAAEPTTTSTTASASMAPQTLTNSETGKETAPFTVIAPEFRPNGMPEETNRRFEDLVSDVAPQRTQYSKTRGTAGANAGKTGTTTNTTAVKPKTTVKTIVGNNNSTTNIVAPKTINTKEEFKPIYSLIPSDRAYNQAPYPGQNAMPNYNNISKKPVIKSDDTAIYKRAFKKFKEQTLYNKKPFVPFNVTSRELSTYKNALKDFNNQL